MVRERNFVSVVVTAISCMLLACGCSGPGQNGGGEAQDTQIATFSSAPVTGNTSKQAAAPRMAKASSSDPLEIPALTKDDVIIRHGGFVVSYNDEWYIPNWVAYELTEEELDGYEERGDRMFSMDPKYRKTQAMREDYSGSGWTKGHMAPAADFRWSSDAMDETFYLTNVCPQDEALNANDWEYLERQVRSWARKYGRAWVVTGPIVNENKYGRIGERGVVVPDSFFKAVLVPKNGKYCSIAFVMDNDAKRYWLRDCALSVNELEDITGTDFFPALDDSVENSVEGQLRFSDWGIK